MTTEFLVPFLNINTPAILNQSSDRCFGKISSFMSPGLHNHNYLIQNCTYRYY